MNDERRYERNDPTIARTRRNTNYFPPEVCVRVLRMRIFATFHVNRSAVMGFVLRMLLRWRENTNTTEVSGKNKSKKRTTNQKRRGKEKKNREVCESGQKVFKNSRVESGWVRRRSKYHGYTTGPIRRFSNLTGRLGSFTLIQTDPREEIRPVKRPGRFRGTPSGGGGVHNIEKTASIRRFVFPLHHNEETKS